MRTIAVGIAVLMLAVQVVDGQTPQMRADTGRYSPRYELPNGKQIVVVYIGATSCGPCRTPEFKDVVRRMKPLLARQADSLKRPLSINGVAIDWVVDSGYAFLKEAGEWDEITVGNNWVNVGALRYIWGDTLTRPAMPQVIIYERTMSPELRRIGFGAEVRVGQFVGSDDVTAWVKRGAPIPMPQK